MPKILVLPGYLQSGKIFAEKASGIRKLLTKQNYELDFIDPPYVIAHHKDLVFQLGDTSEEADAKWQGIVDSNANRCWWQHDDKGGYIGFEDSLKFLMGYMDKNGPFDGIMGFSQGAAMSAIVANHMAKIGRPQFKVAILFSGFCFTLPKDKETDAASVNYATEDLSEYIPKVEINPIYLQYYETHQITTQVFNVFGAADMVVPAVRSKFLSQLYKHSQNFEHEGGHMIPNKKPFLRPLVEKINEAYTKSNL